MAMATLKYIFRCCLHVHYLQVLHVLIFASSCNSLSIAISDGKCTEAMLLIRTGCSLHNFSLIMDESHVLLAGIQPPGESVSLAHWFESWARHSKSLHGTQAQSKLNNEKHVYEYADEKSCMWIYWYVDCPNEWQGHETYAFDRIK